MKKVLNAGVVLTQGSRGVSNNLPGPKFNNHFHVRPKGRDGSDKVELPDGQWITKQCYWMDRQFVAKIIADLAK